MRFPFFASFIVFCIWLSYELHKRRNIETKADNDFWQKEAKANNTRRKSLDTLDYIEIPFDQLPISTLSTDPVVSDCLNTLHELSLSPIVNLTGISNTDLKLQYGAPNIELLSQYDQRYTVLARTLQSWANALYEKGYTNEARQILEFAVKTRTDVSASYKLLSAIYQETGRADLIKDLIPIAESLNSPLKSHILQNLNELCQ